MEQLKCTTNSSHRKGAHLTFEERVIIQIRLRDGWSAPKIGSILNVMEIHFMYRHGIYFFARRRGYAHR